MSTDVVGNVRAVLNALICTVALAGSPAAQAQTASTAAQAKLSADLQAAISSSTAVSVPWARSLNGELLVRVIVSANSDDALLTSLRQAVLSLGGSVYYNYASIRAVAVLLPASRLLDLAARDDVLSISPNRPVARTASTLQLTTGASVAPPPARGALDGSGVGIAVLDSGLDWNHQSLGISPLGLKGPTRVRQVLDFARIGQTLADPAWTRGVDLSASVSVTLDGSKFTSALQLKQQPSLTLPDPYGHGTHVAAAAAGSAAYQWPDTTGVAPNASLYDLRVLDDKGVGNLADVIAGIAGRANKTIIVENNYSGQFARYLRSETSIVADGHIRKYDGEPFMPHHIVEGVQAVLAGAAKPYVPVHEIMV